jgi:hypothetical protein
MKQDHRQAILEVVAMGTLPSVLRNLHAAHLAGLLGKVSAHMWWHSNAKLTHSRRKKMSAANQTPELPVVLATARAGGCWVERLVRPSLRRPRNA